MPSNWRVWQVRFVIDQVSRYMCTRNTPVWFLLRNYRNFFIYTSKSRQLDICFDLCGCVAIFIQSRSYKSPI